jgi:hypothetical protein
MRIFAGFRWDANLIFKRWEEIVLHQMKVWSLRDSFFVLICYPVGLRIYRTKLTMIATKPNMQRLTQGLSKAVSSPSTAKNAKDEKNLVSSLTLAINKLIDDLARKTSNAKTVSAYLSELTWVDIKDEKTRETITGLLDLSQVWYNLELDYIETIQPVIHSGIAANEFKAYKEAIEDLAEAISDLTSAVITLPASKEFNDAMKELSNL